MQKLIIGQTYKHFKGNYYKIIAFAKNSETEEEMIVYESIETNDVWVRPKYMWVLIDKAYQHCAEILNREKEKLQAVVDFLLAHETMSGKQFAQCMEGQSIDADGKFSLFDGFSQEEQ